MTSLDDVMKLGHRVGWVHVKWPNLEGKSKASGPVQGPGTITRFKAKSDTLSPSNSVHQNQAL